MASASHRDLYDLRGRQEGHRAPRPNHGQVPTRADDVQAMSRPVAAVEPRVGDLGQTQMSRMSRAPRARRRAPVRLQDDIFPLRRASHPRSAQGHAQLPVVSLHGLYIGPDR